MILESAAKPWGGRSSTMAIGKLNNVAIIGAGIAGLSLALFLKRHGITVTVYDMRVAGQLPYSGPLALTPNGLRAAEAIGVYSRLRPHGTDSRYVTTMSNDHKLVDQREIGNAETYGYDALRIYRQATIDVLTQMAVEAGIEVCYERKFSHVESETEKDVTVAFAGGELATHDLVVGADGIYSSVRKYLHPEVKPTYTGRIAVAALAPTSSVQLPFPDYPIPTSVGSPFGHVILCPNGLHDPVCPVATGCLFPELEREGWTELGQDKQRLSEILRQQYDKWNPMIQGVMDAADPETLFMWPFYTVPHLDTWTSAKNRVVILGDAAHGLPPIGALGANLALEDAHSFGLLVACANEGKVSWRSAVQWWQQYRQDRMDRVASLTNALAKKRQQPDGPGNPAAQIKPDDTWVFELDVEKDVRQWLG